MPPRKRPHSRSLDAMFPRPKKAPVKLCAAGHRQSSRWKPGNLCVACEASKRLRDAAAMEKAISEEWRRALGPVPAVLETRVVSTGQVIRYAIPKHLQSRPRSHRSRRQV